MWSASVKKFWLHFFEVYKNHTCLWDVDSVEYSDKVKRKEAYEELIRLARKVNANADHDFIRARINNVRTAYRKEVRKVLIARENGSVYKPKLFYFDLLNSFLNHDNNLNLDLDLKFKQSYSYNTDEEEGDPYGTLEAPVENDDSQQNDIGRESVDGGTLDIEEINDELFQNEFEAIETEKSTNTITVKEDLEYNNDIALTLGRQTADQNTNTTYQRKGKRFLKRERKFLKEYKDSNDSECDKGFVDRESPEKKPRIMDDDECAILGKRVATHFRNMRPQQRLFAEKIISDVCIYARMDQLTLRSGFIIDLPPNYNNFAQNRVLEHNYCEETVTEEDVELAPESYIETV